VVLGVSDQTREVAEAAASKWDGEALEGTIMMSGGCGAFPNALLHKSKNYQQSGFRNIFSVKGLAQ